MAKKVDFKLNLKGLRELMTSAELQSIMQEKGNGVAAAATSMSGEGAEYGVRTKGGYHRAVTYVSCENGKALRDCYENNTLSKALYGGKG